MSRSSPAAGQKGGCGKPCCKETADLFQAEHGSEERQLLQHFFEVNPRNEDLDISANALQGGSQPAGRQVVGAGATERVLITARRGLVLYVDAVCVKRSDGNLDMSLVTVAVRKGGVQVGFLPETKFSRRVFLDRDDQLEIVITNDTGGQLTFDFQVQGFARRSGIPVMQPDRSGGRS